jgi:hypothetical protein
MATVTKGRTFVSGEVVTPTKLNNLVDLATVTQIVDADISATAAIADSKLATIATAGKVSGNAITSGTIGGSTAINTTGTITSGTITANLTGAVTGNASSATRLATARAFSAIGDVTTVSAINFDGTAAVALNLAVGNGVIDNLNIAAAAGIVDTKLATIATAGKVANSATTATSANTANAIVARDASGNFTAGMVSASALSTTGNVSVGGNLIPTWKIRTSAYTAISGDMVGANTAAGSWTLTLPASPTAGMMVTIFDAGSDWFTRPLTVARNGSTIDNLAENLICDVSNKIVVLLFNGTTWSINQ